MFIGLLYLLKLKKLERLDKLISEYEKLDFRARETMVTAARAGKILNDAAIDYVIFKTIRPYPATPNDVDIVCLDGKSGYKQAIQSFYDAGYFTFDKFAPLQVQFSDPRGKGVATWDKKGGTFYVDLYRMPGADYFVYLDPRKLREQIVLTNLGGCEVKILRPEVELASILMHSVFPESTFPIEIFYTISYCLSHFDTEQIDRFIGFADNNCLNFPVRICLSLASFIHAEAFGYTPPVMTQITEEVGGEYQREISSFYANDMKAPYKYLAASFFLTFLNKLRDPTSLKSLGVQGFHMLNPVFMKDALSSLYKKVTAGTYAQK